jgi:hypothetical protein
MSQPVQTTRTPFSRARLILVPAMAVAALALTTTAASAVVDSAQPKPQLSVAAERTPQGARITLKGKNWPANARIKVTASRAPGTNTAQDFGMIDADEKGEFNKRVLAQCSTNNRDDGQLETVTFTAADSATGVKVTAKTSDGFAWVCM